MSRSPSGLGRSKTKNVRLLALAIVSLAGCLPDTGGFVPADGDGSVDGGTTDGGVTDGGGPLADGFAGDGPIADGSPGTDLGPPQDFGPPQSDDCLPEPTCADGCPMPWLLASIEDLPGGRVCGGRIARFSVAAGDTPCVCTGYDLQGSLPPQPVVVGFVPPSTVVTADFNGRILAIDAGTDRELWSVAISGMPSDVFTLESPEGVPYVGVALKQGGQSHVSEIQLIDASPGADRTPIVRRTNGDLGLGLNVASVTQSSTDRLSFRSLDRNDEAALDLNPWTGAIGDPPYVPARSGAYLSTLYSARVGSFHRTVWTGVRQDLAGAPSRVWDVNHAPDDPDFVRLGLGTFCESYDDGADYDGSCEFLQAVPDPAVFDRTLALCAHAGGRRITRVRATGNCLDIVEDGAIYPSARISDLALALPTYWTP